MIELLIVVGERKKEKALIKDLKERGARLFNVVYGRGVSEAMGFMDAIGFGTREDKVIIFAIVDRANRSAVIDALNGKFKFGEPKTGIGVTVPIDSILRRGNGKIN